MSLLWRSEPPTPVNHLCACFHFDFLLRSRNLMFHELYISWWKPLPGTTDFRPLLAVNHAVMQNSWHTDSVAFRWVTVQNNFSILQPLLGFWAPFSLPHSTRPRSATIGANRLQVLQHQCFRFSPWTIQHHCSHSIGFLASSNSTMALRSRLSNVVSSASTSFHPCTGSSTSFHPCTGSQTGKHAFMSCPHWLCYRCPFLKWHLRLEIRCWDLRSQVQTWDPMFRLGIQWPQCPNLPGFPHCEILDSAS